MPKSGTVILAGTIRVAPERLADLRPYLKAQVEGSRAEPGCLDYALSEDPLDPGLIRVFEHFVDEAALAFHRASPHMAAALSPDLNIEERIYGGASYDAHGTPLTDAVRDAALASDAVLMGAVGGPQWANAPRHLRPEAGLLNLRKAMDVYANLRPAYCFEALADASSLKRELVSGLDIMFVRELTGGVYFGQPRGIEDLGNGQKRGVDTQVYTT